VALPNPSAPSPPVPGRAPDTCPRAGLRGPSGIPALPTPVRTILGRAASALCGVALALALLATPAEGQNGDRGELRLGVVLGGTGFLGLVTEYRQSGWGGELTIGTLSFREVSVSVVGKRYFGSGVFQPAVGAGLWSLTAWTEDGSGSILIARLPLAVDWNVTGGHALGLEVAMNRALAVNRLDPEDDTPPNRTIVPLPGLYYRYGWHP
jgi:hypothetical protein